MSARPDGRFATFALLSVAILFLVVAGYLFLSSVLIENDCALAGDVICVAALRRIWAAGGMAGAFVVTTGIVGVKIALGQGGRRDGQGDPGQHRGSSE
jgi:hypothetical protein